VGNKILIAAP